MENYNKIVSLINEIVNEDTLKIIVVIQGNTLLSSMINEIECAEELRAQIILELGEQFYELIPNEIKICWNQILWFFRELEGIKNVNRRII